MKIIDLKTACSALAIMLSQGAFGQTSTPTLTNSSIETDEIIVTAQKRKQSIADVGITIVAATGEQLKQAGVSDLSSLARIAPGFTATKTIDGYPIFSLRGVNFAATQLSAQPAVSTYVDEAVLAYPAMSEGLLLDVERVEILKGPQGTLFGQNATGGSINIIAAKPTNILEAAIEFNANHFGEIMLDGHISGPITENLLARFAATTTQFGAWQKGYFGTSRKNGESNRGAARLLLEWTPTSTLKLSANLSANFNSGEPQAIQLASINIAAPAGAFPGMSDYPLPPRNNRAADFDPDLNMFSRNKAYQAVLRGELSLNENTTLTSITNYAHLTRRERRDVDATIFPLAVETSFGNISSFNQEIRLSGTLPSSGISYVLGGNYQKDGIRDGTDNFWNGYSGLPRDFRAVGDFKIDYRSAGVFGNADWEFADRLTLTAGARYTSSKQNLNGCFQDAGDGSAANFFEFLSNIFRSSSGLPPATGFVPGGCVMLDDRPVLPGGSATFLPYKPSLVLNEDNISWRAGLNFKPDHGSLVYGLVSRGYKSGAFPAGNVTNATQVVSVKQEELTSYEVGTKIAMFNRAIRLNAALFYYDYKNKQFQTYVATILGPVQTFRNIPETKVKGVDIDVTIVPFEGLSLRSAWTYVDSKIGSFAAFDVNGNPANLSGKRLNYSPKVSGMADFEYRFTLGALDAFVGGNALFNSTTFADLDQSPQLRIAAYTVFDARVGLISQNGWRTSLWVRNLTDKYYWTNMIRQADSFGRFTGMPRTFGVTTAFSF